MTVPVSVRPVSVAAPACRGRPRQTEVEQLHAVRSEEDVRGFQVAMHHAPAMQRLECGQDSQRNLDRLPRTAADPQSA